MKSETLKWTQGALPTLPGWYWIRYLDTKYVIKADEKDGKPLSFFAEYWPDMKQAYWAGPIPEPIF